MKKRGFLYIIIFWTSAIIVISCNRNDRVDFNAEIRPILNKNCIACHGGVKESGGFGILFPEDALRPTDSGKPAIIPGDPENSEFVKRLEHHDPELRMPLEKNPLSKDEIALIKKWIKQGAQWDDHWSFTKPLAQEPPQINSTFVKNDIDRFILNKLKENELKPSPEADKTKLIRRLSLDLIGLPPSYEEVEDFLKDKSPDAYEKLVERLLASQHFGEKWAAMWMDLARYADTKGYEKDQHRNIWRYRDYVIRSFNEDKPFDQFTTEQLAGDLLSDPTDDQLIATAFNRNTMNNDEAGTDDEEFRVAAVMDRVNTTFQVWQGITMECVQCHSHTYDPIRHEEYYQVMAFFNNSRDEDVTDESPNLRFFTEIESDNLEEIKNWLITNISDNEHNKVDEYTKLVRVVEPKVHPHSFDVITKGSLADGKYLRLEDEGHARLKSFDLKGKSQVYFRYRSEKAGGMLELRLGSNNGKILGTFKIDFEPGWKTASFFIESSEKQEDLFLVYQNNLNPKNGIAIEWVLFNEAFPGYDKSGYSEIEEKVLKLINAKDKMPIMMENPSEFTRKTHVFERGNWLSHGDEVKPGTPSSLNPFPEGASQDRLGFAQWLVNKDNPLTARVAVNRFWEQLFGLGLVVTLEDFGSQGQATSHPELLDWLALRFIEEHDWSMKKILKDMVMSATYRQASKVNPEQMEKDPDNRFLSRASRVRLSAEQIRDQALFVSGLLSSKLMGPSVMPSQPEGIWQTVYSGMEWKESEGEDKYRRAVYTYLRRTSPYPSAISFDSPSREFCVVRRISTNTPLQALVTLNDPVYVETALALADKMLISGKDIKDQIRTGYKRALFHEPDENTLNVLEGLYENAWNHFSKNPESAKLMVQAKSQFKADKTKKIASLTLVANAIMNLDEFLTKD